MLARDAVADRQAEARAQALGLGREERVEHPAPDLGRNARPVVRDLELDLRLRRGGVDRDRAHRVDRHQGLLGVDHEVQEHLLHF